MSLRGSSILLLSFLACADGNGRREIEPEGSPGDLAGGAGATQGPQELPPLPQCPVLGVACVEGFVLTLEANESWPLGRYFLRVALDRRPPTVCEVAFEPVVGAVTDTCNGRDSAFRVDYRYDHERRAIESISFGMVRHVDLEILVAEDLPPIVEVHHDVVVRKCSYACNFAAPLVAQVQMGRAALPNVDAGDDSGPRAADAAVDGAP